jgi:glutathione synthase/RimK-type ligase-like ATP-grasp enzyme
MILDSIKHAPIYPSIEEMLVYENKKMLSYWLAAHKVPHPKTWVFYYEKEALEFVKKAALPVVAKTSIGAAGSGVQILRSQQEAEDYIKNTFSGQGASHRVGPKWRQKGFLLRVLKKLLRPQEFKAKLQLYKHLKTEVQKDFVILQEYIHHDFEWRCVRIKDSYFAHKKIKKGDKASGSLIKVYENPPLEMFDFIKEITDKRKFLSQSVDLFVTQDGQYLVNEMQCVFGQSDPYQMLIDGEPGRYRQVNGRWVFEAGDFNRYESFLLRLEHFIEILNQKKLEEVS